MLSFAAVALSALLSSALAAPHQDVSLGPSNAKCVRSTYAIPVSSMNVMFSNYTAPAGVDNTTYITALQQRFVTDLPTMHNIMHELEAGNGTHPRMAMVSDTYKISGVLCTPNTNKVPNAVQLLIHGIGFDASYWHVQGKGIPTDHSYVMAAANAGYTTFRYDRLGTGYSQHPNNTYNAVQGSTDVAIAKAFAQMLRQGKIGGKAYSTIAAVGHSYGSIQVQALTQTPGLVDHAVLTGFSADGSATAMSLSSLAYAPARAVFPDRFGPTSGLSLAHEYLVSSVAQASQMNFLYWPFYPAAAAALARETEQPVTQGVLMTFGSIPAPAPKYKGTVAVVTGEKDFIFCSGNCYNVPTGMNISSIPAGVQAIYPAASKFETYLPANTGHGIMLHYTAGETNRWVQSHLASL